MLASASTADRKTEGSFHFNSSHLNVDVQKASFRYLEHQAHLSARVHALEEALFRVSIDANEVAARCSAQNSEQDDELGKR